MRHRDADSEPNSKVNIMYYTTQSLKSAVAHFIANGSETEKEIAKAIRGNGYDNVENTVFMFTENTDISYDDCIAAKQAIEAMAEENA